MGSKGKITEIVDKQVFEQFIQLNKAVELSVEKMAVLVGQAQNIQIAFKDAKGIKELTDAYKLLSKEQIKTDTETKKAIAAAEKLAAKEKQLSDALNTEAKTVAELRLQNSALKRGKNQVNLKTDEGKKKVTELNQKLDENNKKIKENVSGLEKQKIGIGGYADSIGGLAKKWALMGLGAIGITSITAAITGAIKKNIEYEASTEKLSFALNDNQEAVKRMVGFAKTMSATSLFSRLDIQAAEQMALSLGRTEEQTKKMITAAMGLSRVTGVDLNAAMLQMNMTFSGSTGRLARYAPELKDLTEEQLKAGGAVDLLAEKMGKFATSGLDTTEGKLNQLTKSWNKFTLSIVTGDGIVSKIVNGSISLLTEAFDGMAIAIEGASKWQKRMSDEMKSSQLAQQISNDKTEVEELAKSLTAKGIPAQQSHKRAIELTIESYQNLIKSGKGNKVEYESQIKALQEYSVEVKKVPKLTAEQIKANEDAAKKRKEIAKKLQEDIQRIQDIETSMIVNNNEKELQEITNKYNREYELAKGNKALQKTLNDKYIFDIQQANKKYDEKEKEERIKSFEEEIKQEVSQNKPIVDNLKLRNSAIIDLNKDLTKDFKKSDKEIADSKKKMWDDIKSSSWNAASQIGNTLNQLTQINLDKDLAAIDEKSQKDNAAKEAELKAAGNNQALKDKINAKYEAKEKIQEKERKKIEAEKAKANKQTAIFNIILSTAQAIASHLFGFQQFLIPFDILTGGLQLAVALAAPIPKYKHGRKGGEAEFAVVGDGGTEGIQLASGERFLTPNKDTLAYLPKGASVIPNYELFKNSAFDTIPEFNNTFNMDLQQLSSDVRGLQSGFIMVANTIQNKKETHFYWENGELRKAIKNGNSMAIFINDKLHN